MMKKNLANIEACMPTSESAAAPRRAAQPPRRSACLDYNLIKKYTLLLLESCLDGQTVPPSRTVIKNSSSIQKAFHVKYQMNKDVYIVGTLTFLLFFPCFLFSI